MSHDPDHVTDLGELAGELLAQARVHPSERAAATIFGGPVMRATVIALRRGAELAEHDAPPAATLQVLDGRVRLFADQQEWVLETGQTIAIPTRRHGLEALTDAAVLLTVALA